MQSLRSLFFALALSSIPVPALTQGNGLLPRFEAALPPARWFRLRLAQFGYGVAELENEAFDAPLRAVLTSLQMRFRPARHDGEPDAETAAILAALTQP